MKSVIFAAYMALATTACTSDDATTPGPLMRPGANCLSCHRAGGQAAVAPWTAGGTVYETATAEADEGVEGVEVIFMDGAGVEVTRVTTNAAGNFYTDVPLPTGFTVAVERGGKRETMPKPPPAGSCNACHAKNPTGEAKGRIRAPQ